MSKPSPHPTPAGASLLPGARPGKGRAGEGPGEPARGQPRAVKAGCTAARRPPPSPGPPRRGAEPAGETAPWGARRQPPRPPRDRPTPTRLRPARLSRPAEPPRPRARVTLAVTLGPLFLKPSAAGARKHRQATAPRNAAGPPRAMALRRALRRLRPPPGGSSRAMWRGGRRGERRGGRPSRLRPALAPLGFGGGVEGDGGGWGGGGRRGAGCGACPEPARVEAGAGGGAGRASEGASLLPGRGGLPG